MILCSNKCPHGKFSGCCVECPYKESCDSTCCKNREEALQCEQAKSVFPDENTAIEAFGTEQKAILNEIISIVDLKKAIEEREKSMKDKLKEAMEKYNIQKFESDVINITYIAPSTVKTIDTGKLKKIYPQIANECAKSSERSAYIKVEVKGANK